MRLTLIMLLVCAPALAHQKKEAITRVIFNERTGSIEVIHRFLLHDAEHAVKQIFGGKADIIGSKQTQKDFSKYIMDRFKMADAAGKELTLQTVGYEVEGKHIWVYQETPIRKGLEGLQIIHNALRDIWPKQVNLVNIERKKKIQSLLFTGRTGVLDVNFEAAED
ncbi:MAG: hypothetical protein QNK37_22600 [Acidobacteriota bacterium]|nr:hypothetical protein [Acidobacteriota bacterium]